MGKATLVVMAAGIGSRFGGIKQLAQVGPNGEVILDYGVYDALEAGFDKVVFVIRKDLEREFKERIGQRIEKHVETAYVYQEIADVPDKHKERLAGREKPWGTGQAILCCKDVIQESFLVINSDDYYGKEAYREAYAYLTGEKGTDRSGSSQMLSFCMVGFVLRNTLSENGGVTRGICKVDDQGYLADIVETSNLLRTPEGAAIQAGQELRPVDADGAVSMNMWGLTPEIFPVLEEGFDQFLSGLVDGTEKKEYLLPNIIRGLLEEERAKVRVLWSQDRWFGVTYQEDRATVERAMRELTERGVYPDGHKIL